MIPADQPVPLGPLGPLGPLVVGLGAPDRGDDAVGIAVARSVGALGLSGVQVTEHEDPTGLIDLWADRDVTVVIDAMVSGQPPGTVHLVEAGGDAAALPESAWAGEGRGGTHGFGIAAAVGLARALGRLPRRLVIVGVEAAGFDYGTALSGPVAAAVPDAVAQVLAVLEGQVGSAARAGP